MNLFPNKLRLTQYLHWIPWSLPFLIIAFWAWFGRVVDLTWEGWAMRAQMLAERMPTWKFTSAYSLCRPLFLAVQQNIFIYNFLFLSALACSAAMSGYWVVRGDKNNLSLTGRRVLPWLTMSFAGVLVYAPSFIAEYNHLAVLNTMIAVALVSATLQSTRKSLTSKLLFLAAVLGILASVKVTAGLLFSMAIWSALYAAKINIRLLGLAVAFQILVYSGCCFVSGSGVFSGIQIPAAESFPEFNSAIKPFLAKAGFQNVPATFLYVSRLLILNLAEGLIISLFVLGILGVHRLGLPLNTQITGVILMYGWVMISVAFFLMGGERNQQAIQHRYESVSFWGSKIAWYGAFSSLPFLCVVVDRVYASFWRLSFQRKLLAGILLIGPLLCSWGTAFRLSHHAINYLWMWAGLLFLLVQSEGEKRLQPVAWFAGAISVQAMGALAIEYFIRTNHPSAEISMAGYPSGKYLVCAPSTYRWLKEIDAAAQRIPIHAGEEVFCRGEFLPSFFLGWKNLSPELPMGRTRYAILNESRNFHPEPLSGDRPARNFLSRIFGPPGPMAGGGLDENQLRELGYRKSFQVFRPDGNMTVLYAKP